MVMLTYYIDNIIDVEERIMNIINIFIDKKLYGMIINKL